LSTGASEKEARYTATSTVLADVSAADRKRNEKEMKQRTTRLTLIPS